MTNTKIYKPDFIKHKRYVDINGQIVTPNRIMPWTKVLYEDTDTIVLGGLL